MPKFFKNSTTGSGNLSLSTRIKIREADNRVGAYPTIHRMGNVSRKGNFLMNPFNDNNTLIFGELIKDRFDTSGYDDTTIIDSRLWNSSPGLKIRRDQSNTQNTRSLVFDGNNPIRFIETKNKIRNAEITLHVQLGPYDLVRNGLNLSRPDRDSASNNLKIQISTNGTSYTTIRTIKPTSNIESFYGKNAIKTGNFTKVIKIGREDIPNKGADYFVRVAHEQITDARNPIWALALFEIQIFNQEITYGINNQIESVEGFKVLSDYVSNTQSVTTSSFQLSGKGAVTKGVSDSMSFLDMRTEKVNPFNEAATSDITKVFYQKGLSESVYPGFNQPTKDKTFFEVDLTPTQETEFGYTDKYNNTSTSNSTNQLDLKLMTYWNSNLSRWEVIGDQGFRPGHPPSSPINDTILSLALSNSAAPVGFGPGPNSVLKSAQKSGGSSWSQVPLNSDGLKDVEFHHEDYYNALYRPTDNFGFPFADQYHATSSQYVLAKDLGITKPFVLERCALSFSARFQFGSAENYAMQGIFEQVSSGKSDKVTLRHRLIVPTFFILRQGNNQVDKTFTRKFIEPRGPNIAENTYRVTSGSRDLITYGQFTLINSGSTANGSANSGLIAEKDYIYKLLDLGLRRDGVHIHEYDVTETYPTGSFQLEFDCKTSPKYADSLCTSVFLMGGEGFSSVQIGDTTPGRSDDIDSGNRALVNGYGAAEPGTIANVRLTNGVSALSKITPPKAETIEKESPYVIFPDDRLIFGWQYPLSSDNLSKAPFSSDTRFSTMVLDGRSKLKLFGSLIANNKEFHETRNQNLFSPALYEHVINNEKIIDQWQIERRFQHSGSFFDNHFDSNNLKRLNRIGLSARSIVGGQDTNASGSFLRFFQSSDNSRTFIDSSQSKGAFFHNSSFGTMNTIGFDATPTSTIAGGETIFTFTKNPKGSKIKPRYYFNKKHYGYIVDLVKQSHDSKYLEVLRLLNANEKVSAESPVKIIFVKGESVDTPEVKVFRRKFVDDYLNETDFQSSNISIFATASSPFIDDSIPKNRPYVSASFIVV